MKCAKKTYSPVPRKAFSVKSSLFTSVFLAESLTWFFPSQEKEQQGVEGDFSVRSLTILGSSDVFVT